MSASGADCARDEHWSPPVFSPNLSKLVAAWGSADCTDGPETGPLFVINATTGSTTAVPSADIRLSLREAGWINSSTIWWIDGQKLHQYVVGGAASVLGTLTASFTDDAVLRGNTLFFTVGSGSGYTLKRFNMTSHTVLAGSVNMGTTNPCVCSRNDALTPGFDVSPDSSHIVYQKTAPASGTSGDEEGVASSQFFYANCRRQWRVANRHRRHSRIDGQDANLAEWASGRGGARGASPQRLHGERHLGGPLW